MKMVLILLVFSITSTSGFALDVDGRQNIRQSDYVNTELDRYIKENSGPNYFSIFHQLIKDSREIEKITDPNHKSKDLYLKQTKDHQIQEIWDKNIKIVSLSDLGFNSIKYNAQDIRFSSNKKLAAVFFRVMGNTEEQKIFFIDLIHKKRINNESLNITPIQGTKYKLYNNHKFEVKDLNSNFGYFYNIKDLFFLLKEYPIKKNNDLFESKLEQNGFEQKITATNKTNQDRYEYILPSKIINFNISQKNKKIIIKAETQSESGTIQWSPLNNKIIISKKLTYPTSLNYADKMITSFDGTSIPVRLIYLNKFELKNRPVLIDSYGGFNMENLISKSNLNKMKIRFLEHGGVIATTGLRGGSEFGIDWHTAGSRWNKHKPIEDLASVAKWLIDQGISRNDKIVSYGASNGGFVVTQTGLKHPNYFGLIISNNGVLDLMNKEDLDPIYGGWFEDFLNSNDNLKTFNYIQNLSPLENADLAKNGPEFLIMFGKNDTRVNPEHSIRMGQKLSSINEAKYNLIGVHSAGHYAISYQHNGQMGLRFQQLMWTKIYNFLGLKF